MERITEDYVSFETAKLLKEKGFNEGCRSHYGTAGSFSYEKYEVESSECEMHNAILAPTLQMAMKWLREVHKLYVDVYIVKNYDNKTIEYCITIEDLNFPGSDDGIDCCNKYKTYEQACEEAIKYCLENLI
jgi:hypothetical protein